MPAGGRTTFETAGRTQTIRDGSRDGEIVSRSTNVHVRFRDFVNDLNDLNFRAERSFLKEAADPTSSEELALGYSPSVRTDAYEYRPEDGTLCVYDLKAGRRGLSIRRSDILATAAYLGMKDVRRVIMLEVRPRK